MKKIVITISVLLISAMFLAPMANAQERTYFINVGPFVSFPSGNFNSVANAGVGISGSFAYGYSPNIDFLGEIGYVKWGGKTNGIDFVGIPIEIGGKYFLSTSMNRFYVGGLFGLHIIRTTTKVTIPGTTIINRSTSSETDLGIAPIAGYQVDLTNVVTFDGQAQYQFVSGNRSYFGLRGSLSFKIH